MLSPPRLLFTILVIGNLGSQAAYCSDATLIDTWCVGDSPLMGRPYSVALGPTGELFVLSFDHIQRFSTSGALITEWGSGEFHAYQLDVDSNGTVYVADSENHRVLKFDSQGVLLDQWGGVYGSGNGQFEDPWGISISPQGTVLVSDGGTNRIQKFSQDGIFLSSFEAIGSAWSLDHDTHGNLYAAIYLDLSIQKFDPDGNSMATWMVVKGPCPCQSDQATGVVVLGDRVYAADQNWPSILVYTLDGTLLGSVEAPTPVVYSIAVTSNKLILPDWAHQCIKFYEFALTPVSAVSWGRLKSRY